MKVGLEVSEALCLDEGVESSMDDKRLQNAVCQFDPITNEAFYGLELATEPKQIFRVARMMGHIDIFTASEDDQTEIDVGRIFFFDRADRTQIKVDPSRPSKVGGLIKLRTRHNGQPNGYLKVATFEFVDGVYTIRPEFEADSAPETNINPVAYLIHLYSTR